jgi:hypothetical protein
MSSYNCQKDRSIRAHGRRARGARARGDGPWALSEIAERACRSGRSAYKRGTRVSRRGLNVAQSVGILGGENFGVTFALRRFAREVPLVFGLGQRPQRMDISIEFLEHL